MNVKPQKKFEHDKVALAEYIKKKLKIDYPLPFCSFDSRYTSILKTINSATHRWVNSDDVYVCLICDCRFGSHSSEWPCGYPVPRSNDIL